MKSKLTSAGPCAGCGDPVAAGLPKVENLRLCSLCAQVPDEVLEQMLMETVIARCKIEEVTAKINAAATLASGLHGVERLRVLREAMR